MVICEFDDDAGSGFAPNDLATGPRDLARPPDLTPPSNSDGGSTTGGSGGRDMAQVGSCATVENCFNDLDDDCDGVVNNGCPDTVTVGAQVPLATYGGSSGTAGSALCAAGTVVIGARFYSDSYDEYMSGVGVYCGTPTLVRGASSYGLTFAPAGGLGPSFQGADTDTNEDDKCADSSEVGWSFYVNNDHSYVYGMAIDCADNTLTLGADNKLTISFSAVGNPQGPNYLWGSNHEADCAAGDVLVGYKGLTGQGVMIQAQGICAPIGFTYK